MGLIEIYDSELAVKEYIHDLETLHEVLEYRHHVGYEKHKRMNEFKILDGFIWFDAYGNTMVKVSKDAYSPIHIPTKDSICPVCGKGWNLYTLDDYTRNIDYLNNTVNFYHKQCNFIDNLNSKQKQFSEVFDLVYPKQYTIKIIPNEYCRCNSCAPWFVFSTPDGDIKIGWRKRVINIEWLNSYKAFSETFDNEDVTKFSRGIHAWNIEKCVEYLIRAKHSIRL